MISRKKVSQIWNIIMNEGYFSLLEANEHLPKVPPRPFRVLHNRTDVSIRTNHNNTRLSLLRTVSIKGVSRMVLQHDIGSLHSVVTVRSRSFGVDYDSACHARLKAREDIQYGGDIRFNIAPGLMQEE